MGREVLKIIMNVSLTCFSQHFLQWLLLAKFEAPYQKMAVTEFEKAGRN